MQWCEVGKMEVVGKTLCIKDAMVMLSENEESPSFPFVYCDSGEYVFEIWVEPGTFYAARARIRKARTKSELGGNIGVVDVDNGFIGIIDYEIFHREVSSSYQEYEEWSAMELDDELAINFSGQIAFGNSILSYVKSGDGDGSYNCYNLLHKGKCVGIECVFEK